MTSFDFRTAPKTDVACPLCAARDLTRLASIDRYWMGVQTVACTACGMITTSPILSHEALSEFYASHYRRIYAKTSEPSLQYLEVNGIECRAAYSAQFLAGVAGLKGNPRVLDIGCAEGSILRALRAHVPGAVTVGVEPNPNFAAFARAHAACSVVSDLSQVAERSFDLILINHVLEHVPDPVKTLSDLKEYLAPGGQMFIDVPDASAYDDINDLHLAHLHHFTCTTLKRITRAAGLDSVHLERHQPPRHPPSIRTIVAIGAQGSIDLSGPSGDDLEAAARIRAIERKAGWYRVRSALAGRAGRLLGRMRRLVEKGRTGLA